MRKIEFVGSIKEGKLHISYRDKFTQSLQTMNDCRVKITIEKIYKKRSTKTYKDDGSEGLGQNGYYWLIIVSSFKQGWFDTQKELLTDKQAHEKLKTLCNPKTIINKTTGEMKDVGQSTANMNTIEAEEYYQRCREFCFEWFGIDVKLPNEQGELKLNYKL